MITGAMVLAGVALPAASAQATFHLEMVNEVMLASSSGDASVQFVELLDKGGTEEQFTPVFGPYKLVVFDAAGNMLGEQTLDPTGLRTASAAGSEYLISTAAADTAFGVTDNERLTVPLPLDAAQVCFQGSPGNVSCLSYGTISKPVAMNSEGTGAIHGAAPANGQSDQRQADASVASASPTPKAANAAPSAPGPVGAPAPKPFTGARLRAGTAKVDGHGRALVALSCPAGASKRCHGTVTLSTAKGRIGRTGFTLTSGAHRTVRVRLTAAARRAFAKHRRLIAHATVAASDAAGRHKTVREKLTLRS